MPMAPAGFDTFVSPRLSALTKANIQSIADEFPNRSAWITGYVARHMFQNAIRKEFVPFGFAILRRAEAAADEWELACQTLAQLSTEKTIGRYFKALRHLEHAISAIYQGLEFVRKALNSKMFEKNDGSAHERLNFIYNESRHFDPGKLPDDDLHALWLTNTGIDTHTKTLSYAELRDMLRELGYVANAIGLGEKPDLEKLQRMAEDEAKA